MHTNTGLCTKCRTNTATTVRGNAKKSDKYRGKSDSTRPKRLGKIGCLIGILILGLAVVLASFAISLGYTEYKKTPTSGDWETKLEVDKK